MTGAGRDAVDAPEVQVAREQFHHHGRRVAVAHAAALEDERNIVDIHVKLVVIVRHGFSRASPTSSFTFYFCSSGFLRY